MPSEICNVEQNDGDDDDDVTVESKEMVDITWIVDGAADSLTLQEPMLCNKKSFNLQDSMAALELMDRKMDCCEVPIAQVAPIGVPCPNDKMVFPRPAPTGLDDIIAPLPWEDLTIRDASLISLEALVRLEALLSGASVVESTFTCLYAHRPVLCDMKNYLSGSSSNDNENDNDDTIDTKDCNVGTAAQYVVYASTLLMLELTDVLRSIILNADIYEEEDFTVVTYNIAVMDRKEGTTMAAAYDALEMISTLEEQNSDEIRLITKVLRVQIDLLGFCTSMARLAGKTVRDVVGKSQELARSCVQCLDEIHAITKNLKANETDADKQLLKRTFDPYVNRPLVGNAPVRKIVYRKCEESITTLTTIASELDWALCSLLLDGSTLAKTKRMMGRISVSSTNILTRSLIVLNLYFDDKMFGQFSLIDMIAQHMQQISNTTEQVFENKSAKAFLSRLAKPIYDTLKVLILNRNRQRTYIDAVMLHDWASLQHEAQIVDVTYRKETGLIQNTPPYFSLYVLFMTVELMDHYVALGIELKLFCGHHELAIAYWYRDFLLSSLINQSLSIRRAKNVARQQQQQQQQQLGSPSKQSKGKKKGGKNHGKKHQANGGGATVEVPPTKEEIEDEYDFLLLGLKRGLCRGLVRFLAALNQAGLVTRKEFDMTSNARIFQKRFEAFSIIQQPPPLYYNDFLQGSDFSKVAQGDLLVSASECFTASKGMVDKLLNRQQPTKGEPTQLPIQEEEVRQFARVCIGNLVYIQKLKQKVGSDGKTTSGTIEFDLETHGQFCTIKLT